jgi:hypothetical protein
LCPKHTFCGFSGSTQGICAHSQKAASVSYDQVYDVHHFLSSTGIIIAEITPCGKYNFLCADPVGNSYLVENFAILYDNLTGKTEYIVVQ